MMNIFQALATDWLLSVFLYVIIGIIVVVIGYFIIDTTCEYDLEHPFITVLIMLFTPFGLGFLVELFRNNMIDRTKRENASRLAASKQLVSALQADHARSNQIQNQTMTQLAAVIQDNTKKTIASYESEGEKT